MTTISSPTTAQWLRPLAAATAIFYAAAAMAWTTVSVAQVAARALMGEPTGITVDNCSDSGAGSLRAAIRNAVSGDTIDLTKLVCGRISLTTGTLAIDQASLTLTGPGAGALTIDGGHLDSIFHGTGADTLTLQRMSIVNGATHRGDGDDGDATGACVHADGNLVLNGVDVSHCEAIGDGSRSALGGAVWARGELDLEDSTVSDSSADTQGWGYARGGGVYALGGIFMVCSTLSDNFASSIAAARSIGGGAFVRGGAVIFSSTISTNAADRSGGLAFDDNAGNPASLISSTVSGNSARLVGGISARPILQLYNSTIAFNTASIWTDSAGHHVAAGVHVANAIRMNSTIVSNNVNAGTPSAFADITGAVGARFSGAHNNVMACDMACAADTTNGDPGLQPLRYNGGTTRTHRPTSGAWNARGGNNVDGVTWDQRGGGFPRASAAGWIDIGALQIDADGIFSDDFDRSAQASRFQQARASTDGGTTASASL